MLHIDNKYISLIGTQLRNFKKKNTNLYNCSCPICGDSTNKKTKARGYFYQKGVSMYYKCHNCGSGLGLANFLKTNFPSYYDSYIVDRYKENVIDTKKVISLDVTITNSKSLQNSSSWSSIKTLPENHYAKQYVLSRNIPDAYHDKIFYAESFNDLVNDFFPNKYTTLDKTEPRLIIPFYSEDNKLIGLQGRSFSASKKLRYITIKSNADTKLIYGLDTFDSSKPGYVVEGPIDSMFIPNCLAAANSDLESVCVNEDKENLTLIFDNEPKNKEIVNLMQKAIKNGRKICIWPSHVQEKDINEMLLNSMNLNTLLNTIAERTFIGLRAQLEFSQWKKC